MPAKVTAWSREPRAGEIGVAFLNECSARRRGVTLAGDQAAFIDPFLARAGKGVVVRELRVVVERDRRGGRAMRLVRRRESQAGEVDARVARRSGATKLRAARGLGLGRW